MRRSIPARTGARRAAAAAAVLGVALTARAPHAAVVGGRVTVERTATVNAPVVRLGDVAALEGTARAFADVDLGPAPDPGATRRLAGTAILRKLADAGLDGGTTRYQIPATVVVSRAAQEIGADELARAIEDHASEVLASGERVRAVDVAGAVRIPPGAYDTRLTQLGPGRGAARRFELAVVQDGATVATVPARVDVEAFGPVVIARRQIARGDAIGADDVTIEERDVTALGATILRDPRDVIGKEAHVAIAPGAPLTTQAVASPVLVRRGDVVTVVVETAGMRLSLPGDALDTGAAGNRVRAVNRRSRQEIAGHVVDRGTILVQY
jgi:flagella basal body P-ring formation protein FlgA